MNRCDARSIVDSNHTSSFASMPSKRLITCYAIESSRGLLLGWVAFFNSSIVTCARLSNCRVSFAGDAFSAACRWAFGGSTEIASKSEVVEYGFKFGQPYR